MNIDIKINTNNLASKLGKMAVRATNFIPIAPKAKKYLQAANAANFTSNGLLTGGWSPLSPSYSAWKASRFPGAPPLVISGKLFSSVASMSGSETRIMPTSMTFGTSVSYAKFHQYGTSKMAKRQILFIPREFAEWYGNEVASWIVDGNI